MQPYRPLPEQIAEQIEAGRTLIVELDSWYLPDTAATSYRREHVKTSVVAEAIDLDGERLRYFHGPGYFELEGEDYRGVFRLGREFSADVLPPYTELVRFDAGRAAARARSCARRRASCCARHLARRPADQPLRRASATSSRSTCRGCWRATPPPTTTTPSRPCGWSARPSRPARSHVDWLLGERGRRPRGARWAAIVDGCKTLSFKLARRREFDPEPAIAELAAAWEESFAKLDDALA